MSAVQSSRRRANQPNPASDRRGCRMSDKHTRADGLADSTLALASFRGMYVLFSMYSSLRLIRVPNWPFLRCQDGVSCSAKLALLTIQLFASGWPLGSIRRDLVALARAS